MSHRYYETAKQEQRRDYRSELPTFFGQLDRQRELLKGRRILVAR